MYTEEKAINWVIFVLQVMNTQLFSIVCTLFL